MGVGRLKEQIHRELQQITYKTDDLNTQIDMLIDSITDDRIVDILNSLKIVVNKPVLDATELKLIECPCTMNDSTTPCSSTSVQTDNTEPTYTKPDKLLHIRKYKRDRLNAKIVSRYLKNENAHRKKVQKMRTKMYQERIMQERTFVCGMLIIFSSIAYISCTSTSLIKAGLDAVAHLLHQEYFKTWTPDYANHGYTSNIALGMSHAFYVLITSTFNTIQSIALLFCLSLSNLAGDRQPLFAVLIGLIGFVSTFLSLRILFVYSNITIFGLISLSDSTYQQILEFNTLPLSIHHTTRGRGRNKKIINRVHPNHASCFNRVVLI